MALDSAESNPLTKPKHWLDAATARIDALLSFYGQHQELLYRPYLTVYFVVSVIRTLMVAQLFTIEDTWRGEYVIAVLIASMVNVILTLGVYRLLTLKTPNAITLFTVLLGFMVYETSVLFALAGAYVIGNAAFRRAWDDHAPEWYRRLGGYFDSKPKADV